ncbi:MAG: hypothetical protein RJP95_04140 [Pirellulales bacterium]
MHLVITPTGTTRCIYDDVLDLHHLGRVTIRRGSHVEPDAHGRWQADMSPVKGPVLGPFKRRQAALEAERAWLLAHWL